MMILTQLIGALVLIGLCAYGVSKLVEMFMTMMQNNNKDNED